MKISVWTVNVKIVKLLFIQVKRFPIFSSRNIKFYKIYFLLFILDSRSNQSQLLMPTQDYPAVQTTSLATYLFHHRNLDCTWRQRLGTSTHLRRKPFTTTRRNFSFVNDILASSNLDLTYTIVNNEPRYNELSSKISLISSWLKRKTKTTSNGTRTS